MTCEICGTITEQHWRQLHALADRLAKVESACKGCYASAHALANAESPPRCIDCDGPGECRSAEKPKAPASTVPVNPDLDAAWYARHPPAPTDVNGASQCRGMGCRDYPCSCKHATAPQPVAPAAFRWTPGGLILEPLPDGTAAHVGGYGMLPAEPSSDAGRESMHCNACGGKCDGPCEEGDEQLENERLARQQAPAPSEPAKRPPPVSEEERAKRTPWPHPAVMMNASEPAKVPLSMQMYKSVAAAKVFSARVADLEARLASVDYLVTGNLAWPREKDEMNELLQAAISTAAEDQLRLSDQVADLEARLRSTELSLKMHHSLLDEERRCSAEADRDRVADMLSKAEKERDEALAKAERWQRNFDESAKRAHALRMERDDAREGWRAKFDEAVLAERARVNGWWLAWLTQQGNKVMTVGERDTGIASGAPAPGGGT